jgi:hypothetical protein
MDINDLFDGMMRSINQFANEIAEQRLQKKMQGNGLDCSEQRVREPQANPQGMPLRSWAQTGRGPDNGGKNVENFEARERSWVCWISRKESDRGRSAETLKAI